MSDSRKPDSWLFVPIRFRPVVETPGKARPDLGFSVSEGYLATPSSPISALLTPAWTPSHTARPLSNTTLTSPRTRGDCARPTCEQPPGRRDYPQLWRRLWITRWLPGRQNRKEVSWSKYDNPRTAGERSSTSCVVLCPRAAGRRGSAA